MDIDIRIELPLIWEGLFEKHTWNSVNYIVGANGTGKSLFADKLKQQLSQNGYSVRSLTAERLAGFEKTNYNYYTNSQLGGGLNISYYLEYKNFGDQYGLSSSAFVLLQQRLDIRIKIEAILSDLFHKSIRLVEEGGYLKPKMQNDNGGKEYNLKEQECHGLKEIISLLTFLYDDEYNCLILDEPELHLHPQFQSFFLSEIRKMAGDPKEDSSKKLFFIITHSPYFLELQTLDDLFHVLVCHNNRMPSFIKEGDLNTQDEYVLKRFLPRFNTHHKQFFFSPNPVFVEGYTDQQIITLLFEKVGINIAASGSSIIDVGGKDELDVFLRLCKKLSINCRIIADYDSLLRGKLRKSICSDEIVKKEFIKKGLGDDPSKCIGELERLLKKIGDEIRGLKSSDPVLSMIINHLIELDEENNNNAIIDCVLLSIQRYPNELKSLLGHGEKIESALGKLNCYTDAIKASNVYIIQKGELEHFYVANKINYLNISGNKDKLFHDERNYILDLNSDLVYTEYSEILSLLKEAIPLISVDCLKQIRFTIIDFVHRVQIAVERGDVTNFETLLSNGYINFDFFGQILECTDSDFIVKSDKQFNCKILIKPSIIGTPIAVEFDNGTTAHTLHLDIKNNA